MKQKIALIMFGIVGMSNIFAADPRDATIAALDLAGRSDTALAQCQASLVAQQKELLTASTDNKQLREANKLLEANNKDLKESVEEAMDGAVKLKEEWNKDTKALESKKAEVESLIREKNKLEDDLAKNKALQEETKKELATEKQALAKERGEKNAAEDAKSSAQSKLTDALAELATTKASLSRQQKELDDFNRAYAVREEHVQKIEKENDQLKIDLAAEKTKNSTKTTEHLEAKVAHEDQCAGLKREIEQAEAKIKTINDDHKKEEAMLQDQIKALKDKIAGSIPTMADINKDQKIADMKEGLKASSNELGVLIKQLSDIEGSLPQS